MPDSAFVERLNEQIANEFAAHQQYVANAVHYDGETLPRLAAFFYGQAVEERNHAMMMVQYLLDADADVRVPGIDAPRTDFADLAEPVRVALDQERRVSPQGAGRAPGARGGGGPLSQQLMQWVLQEQVGEGATMSGLVKVVEAAATCSPSSSCSGSSRSRSRRSRRCRACSRWSSGRPLARWTSRSTSCASTPIRPTIRRRRPRPEARSSSASPQHPGVVGAPQGY